MTALAVAVAMSLPSLPQLASQAYAMPIISTTPPPISVDETSDIVKVGRRGRHGGRHRGHRRHWRHHRRHHRHRYRRGWDGGDTAAAIIIGSVIVGSMIAENNRRRDRDYNDNRRYHRHKPCRSVRHTHSGYRHTHRC